MAIERSEAVVPHTHLQPASAAAIDAEYLAGGNRVHGRSQRGTQVKAVVKLVRQRIMGQNAGTIG